MLKRIVKYSIGLLLGLTGLLLLAPFFIDTEHYRQIIEQEFTDATGRELKIGRLDASLFPWVGVTLKDVHLANRQGFSEQDFLSIKKLDVQVELLPLLHKSVQIKRFILDEPYIRLEKNAQGKTNWGDFIAGQQKTSVQQKQAPTASKPGQASQPPAQAREDSPPLLAALSADNMVLKHGTLIWRDATGTLPPIHLSDVNVQLNDVQLQHPVHVLFSAKLQQDEIKLDAEVGPVGDLAKVNVNRLPVQLHVQSMGLHLAPWASLLPALPEQLGDIKQAKARFDVQLEQRPDGVRLLAGQASLLAAMDVMLDWKLELLNSQHMKVHQLALQLNQQPLLHMQGDVKSLTVQPRYQFRIKTESLTREMLSQWVPALKEMYKGHPAPWQTVQLGASIAGQGQYLDIRDMQCILNGEVVQISGDMRWQKHPDIRLRVAAKTLHLDPWLPVSQDPYAAQPSENPSKASKTISTSTVQHPTAAQAAEVADATEPDLRFLRPWRVSVQVQMEHLFAKKLDISHIYMLLNGEKGIFALKPLQLELAGGSVSERASLDVNRYPAAWQEQMKVTGLQLKPVLLAMADSDILDGTMKLSTQFHAQGILPQHIRHRLAGSAQLTLLNGRVKGFDIAGGLRNLASFGKASPSKSTDFAQLQGSFQARKGIIKNDDLFMASPLFRLSARGVISLPDLTMDYHARPKLIGSLVGQGDTQQRHGVTIPLRIHGPFSDLSVEPEITTQDVLKEAARLGQKNPAVNKLLKKVKPGSMDKLLGQSVPPQQKKQLERAVKGLLGF